MAAAALAMQVPTHSLEPSENWDDDFKFQATNNNNNSSSSSRRERRPLQRQQQQQVSADDHRKLSVASTMLTEDWDAEEGPSTASATSSSPLTGAPPPSAPTSLSHQHLVTENWDDDFLDARNSPVKRVPLSGASGNRDPHSHLSREESWDDEDEDQDLHRLDPYEDEEFGVFGGRDADAEFQQDDHEDRTVTARSRRAALARLSSSSTYPSNNIPPSPPPPLPSPPLFGIPFNTTSSSSHPSPSSTFHNFQPGQHQHPFPQPQPLRSTSPTASSVFSVPNTVRTYSSSSHLMGMGRAGASSRQGLGNAFSLLPPSPPIHKERERRRLRKKSRPVPVGMVELRSLGGNGGGGGDEGDERRYSFDDDERMEVELEEDGHLELGPPLTRRREGTRTRTRTPLSDASSDVDHNENVGVGVGDHQDRAQVQSNISDLAPPAQALQVPATPTKSGGGGALLSRIGSVKKWGVGVRRKRGGSTAPSEVIASQAENDRYHQQQQQLQKTPRPHSSMSSFHDHSSSNSHYPRPLPPSTSNPTPNPNRLSTTPSTTTSPSSPNSPPVTQNQNQNASSSNPNASSSNWFFRVSSSGPTSPSRTGFGRRPRASTGAASVVSASASSPAATPKRPTPGGGALSRGHSTRTNGSARSSERDRSQPRAGSGRRSASRSRIRTSRDGDGGYDHGRKEWNGSRVGFEVDEKENLRERGRKDAISGGAGTGTGTSANPNLATPTPTQTPSKLVKRKSLGFVKLGRTYGWGDEREKPDSGPLQHQPQEVEERKRRKSLSRLLRGDKDKETLQSQSQSQTPPSLSVSSSSSPSPFVFVDAQTRPQSQVPVTPLQDKGKGKEKEGSRGFMGSVRRISLVAGVAGGGGAKHKRIKSGSGLGLVGEGEGGEGGEVVPASLFFSRAPHRHQGQQQQQGQSQEHDVPPLPSYSLLPLPAVGLNSASQSEVSLRLQLQKGDSRRSVSAASSTSSLHRLPIPSALVPALGLGEKGENGRRVVSHSSQTSGTSSLVPASSSASASASESEVAGGGSAGKGRISEDGTMIRRKGGARRSEERSPATVPATPTIDAATVGRRSMDVTTGTGRPSFEFEARMKQATTSSSSKDKENDRPGLEPPPLPPVPLLPPIELQPPSPPETVTPAHVKRASQGGGRKSLDLDMFNRDAYPHQQQHQSRLSPPPMPIPGTGTGIATVTYSSSNLSVDAQSPSTSTSSVFFTPTSSPRHQPSTPNKSMSGSGSMNRLSPGTGRSPGQQQSASLGRVSAATVSPSKGDAHTLGSGAGGAAGGGESGSGKGTSTGLPPRRNSLGDLKIPARISQAQVGLRRDLGMVREFAGNVEQLKELQQTYHTLVGEVQAILDAHAQHHAQQALVTASSVAPKPAGTAGTGFFSNLASKRSSGQGRPRSNTASSLPPQPPPAVPPTEGSPNAAAVSSTSLQHTQLAYKDLASAFYTINSRYKISWECAELLIELGGGGGDGPSPSTAMTPTPVSSSVSAPLMAVDTNVTPMGKKSHGPGPGRERAITLESKPASRVPTPAPELTATTTTSTSSGLPPQLGSPSSVTSAPPAHSTYTSTPTGFTGNVNASWRASTGRHDLSHRQLVLLREMLNNGAAVSVVDQEADTGEGGGGEGDDSQLSIPEEATLARPYAMQSMQALGTGMGPGMGFVNREWRWGDARNSTITLPSEENGGLGMDGRRVSGDRPRGREKEKEGVKEKEKEKKRRSSRLGGMLGFRDMLRALKRSSHAAEGDAFQSSEGGGASASGGGRGLFSYSTTSLSTQSHSSAGHHRYPHPRIPTGQSQILGRRRAKTSTGPESMRLDRERVEEEEKLRSLRSTSPFGTAVAANVRPPPVSPRRPSLASIFRIGGKGNRPTSVAVGAADPIPSSSSLAPPPLPITPAQSTGTESSLYPPSQSQYHQGPAHVHNSENSSTGEDDYNPEDGEGGVREEEEEEEEDWDRMDSASDLDAAARALGDGSRGTTVRSGRHRRKLSKSRKGRSPYMQRQQQQYQHDSQHPPPPLPLPSSSSTALQAQTQAIPVSASSSAAYSRHSIITKRSFSASQTSLQHQQQLHQGASSPLSASHVPPRPIRLSNVEENAASTAIAAAAAASSSASNDVSRPQSRSQARLSRTGVSPSRPSSSRSTKAPIPILPTSTSATAATIGTAGKTGSVRSMPPQLLASSATMGALPVAVSASASAYSSGAAYGYENGMATTGLAMRPENIKPLLENAKEVLGKLGDCVGEIRALLERSGGGGGGLPLPVVLPTSVS